MASAAARQLTHEHRLAQARLAAETVSMAAAAWPLIDLDDISGTAPAWLQVMTPVVQAQRARSARLAGSYLTAFRALELAESHPVVLAGEAPFSQVTTSLLVTGVYHLFSNLRRGIAPERALAVAQAASSGAAMRLALNAGRETITGTIQADPRGRGYRRVTSGKACSFCSMLAGRGAVYGADSANFDAHDHCSCTAEPVYE